MNPRDENAYGDDVVERMLRDALMREADMVQPSDDGLERITARLDDGTGDRGDDDGYGDDGFETSSRGPGWRPWVAGLVAAAVVGVVVGLVYAGSRDDPTDTAGTPTSTSTSTPTVTTSPETPTESPTAPPAAGELAGVPVYYLGESTSDVWLYREFRDGARRRRRGGVGRLGDGLGRAAGPGLLVTVVAPVAR